MPTSIDRDTVQRLLAEEAAQLVEVLPAKEFSEEHLTGAINIPLKELDERAPRERMDVLLIGRIVFALVFLFSGSTVHLLQARQGIEYARMYRVPAPELLVPLSGLMAVLGALSVILGIWADLGRCSSSRSSCRWRSSCTRSGGRQTSRRRRTRWRTS